MFESLKSLNVKIQVNIRFKADDNFRKIGYGQYEEGKLTTRTIAEGTFEDPNGKDVEIHFLRYSTDKKERTREFVEESYDLMKYDDNSWIYNNNEKVVAFPIPLPDGLQAYTTGKSKNYALIMARNDQSTPALTRIKLTVNPIGQYKTMSRLQVNLNSQPKQLQSSIRKLLEIFVAKSNTNVDHWRVVNIAPTDENNYIVEFTYEKDPEKCEIDNFVSIWNELTGKNLSGSDTDFTNLPRKLSKALSLQKVKVTGIKTIAGDDCNPDIVPPPIPPQPRPAQPTKAELTKIFKPGKLMIMPLDEFGVTLDRVTSVSGMTAAYHFFKIEDNTLNILLPLGNYRSAVQGAEQLILTLVDRNGNEVKVNLRPDDTPDDFFGDFVAGDSSNEPTNTITFDFNTQKESTWNIETSQQALKVLNKVQEARLTWYKLEGTKMIFELPSSLRKCADLKNLAWITERAGKYGIDDYELIGLGEEGFQFARCDNCVICKTEIVTTEKTTSTTTTTTTTTTSTTTTTTTTEAPTTKTRAQKRPCEEVFKGKDGKPRTEVTIRMEVDVNTLLSVNVNKLLEKANLLGNSRSKNFAIKDVTPTLTGVSSYKASEKVINVFPTDYALENKLHILSGTNDKGAAHVITVEHRASRRECNRQLMITLEIYPTLPQRECDFSKRTSHSHEFEIILKNFPSDYTVSDTYDVLKIIKETYGDTDFNNIYLLGFESTSIYEEENSYPAQKVVWGNSTLFNCDSNPECPRDEIYAMTNKLVSKGQEGKTVWKVQKEFIDKFESLPYSLNTVSARGIHSCAKQSESKPAAGAKTGDSDSPDEAGVNSKVVALIVITIGALLLIAACFYMKKRKETSGGTTGPKTKQGVPIMLGDEFNDNREEHDSLIATQNGNTAQYNENSLPAPPLQPEEEKVFYDQPPTNGQADQIEPKVTVTPVAQITSEN